MNYKNKNITLIGAGVSGKGLAALAHGLGANVFVSEIKAIKPETKNFFDANNIEYEEGGNSERAFKADIILLSSGIAPKSNFVQEAERRGVKLTGEIDFVAPLIKADKIIGVTGSNGKSTVTSLIGFMLNKAGFKAGTGGNLGTAAADFTGKDFDAVVLELSSFQLERANILNNFIAVITNLAPDHIDWHGSYENYVKAKAKLIALRRNDGWGIIQDRDVNAIKQALNVKDLERVITLSWDKEPEHKLAGHIFMNDAEKCAVLSLDNKIINLFKFDETDLLGLHNLENIAMSLSALYLMGADISDAKFLLDDFKPLPHRCHNAGVIDGVLYVDDSKGTNVAASATAMQSVPGRKIIILGGRGKGENYAPLAEAVNEYADAAVLLGEEADAINKALLNINFKNIYKAQDMAEAVKIAHDIAKPDMTVLLSPACTSWDMYSSYNQRGEHFCELVNKLK